MTVWQRMAASNAPSWRAFWMTAALLSLLITVGAQWVAGASIRHWEQRFADLIWQRSAQATIERRIVLIDIDERSLAEHGPWPWPRGVQASLMGKLAELGVRQQVWDVVFSGQGPAFSSAAHQGGLANQELAQAVAQHRPVLAQVFGSQPPSEAGQMLVEGSPSGALSWADCPAPFGEASAFMGNHASVLSRSISPAVGHITPRLTQDGVLRHQPAVICFQGSAYPSLALAAIGQSFGSSNWELRRGGFTDSEWVLLLWPAALPEGSRASASMSAKPLITVPLEANGDLPIAWQRQPDAWTALSAADVLAGRVPSGMLTGAWAVVGGSAFGLNDRIATPLQSSAAGFLAHAQILANLLDESVPSRPRYQNAGEWLMAVSLILAYAAVDRAGRRRRGLPSGGGGQASARAWSTVWLVPAAFMAPAVFFLLNFIQLRQGILAGWMAPSLGVAVATLTVGAWSQLMQRAERERLYSHLSSYLPIRVAQVLAGRSPSDTIEAGAEDMVVMMADIRNFSAYCEARPPAEAAAILHAFYNSAFKVVHHHRGVLEALQGDSIVAVWHARQGGHPSEAAEDALAAARALLSCIHEALPDPAPAGLEPLALGIGLESGHCISGSIGPAERRTHLVMGRTVTIASRLVDMTTELAHPILIGEGLASRLGGALGARRLRSLGNFMLEGLRVPHHVYAWAAPAEVPYAANAGDQSHAPDVALPQGIAPASGASSASGRPPKALH